MYCNSCGKQIPEGSLYCNYCGRKTDSVSGPKFVLMRCQNCQGTMTIDEGKNILECPYCKSTQLIIESDQVKMQKIRSDTEKEIEFRKQSTLKDIEASKQYAYRDMEMRRQQVYREVELGKQAIEKEKNSLEREKHRLDRRSRIPKLSGALLIVFGIVIMLIAVEIGEGGKRKWLEDISVIIAAIGFVTCLVGLVRSLINLFLRIRGR